MRDYNTATIYLERALQLLPNSSRIPELLAYVSRRRGRWKKSLSYFKQAQQLDQRNVSLLTQWASTEIMLRDFVAASDKVEQILNVFQTARIRSRLKQSLHKRKTTLRKPRPF